MRGRQYQSTGIDESCVSSRISRVLYFPALFSLSLSFSCPRKRKRPISHGSFFTVKEQRHRLLHETVPIRSFCHPCDRKEVLPRRDEFRYVYVDAYSYLPPPSTSTSAPAPAPAPSFSLPCARSCFSKQELNEGRISDMSHPWQQRVAEGELVLHLVPLFG